MNNINMWEEAKNTYDKFANKGKILGISFHKDEELKKFSDIQKELNAYNNNYLGIQNVPLDKIVGSVQKIEDFKKGFIPKNKIVKTRWCNIYMEMLGDANLPPVNLYKIRDEYYVYDGNHRVSVAHYLNFASIEAEVTEFFSGEATEEDLKYRGKFEFFKETKLDIDLSNGDDYKKLLRDINELNIEGTLEEKANFWNLNIYTPILTILKFNNMVKDDELEGDRYIKFFSHRRYLFHNLGEKKYLYSIVDYMNMQYMKDKYTINTQIKMNYYIETVIKKLYKLDQERYMAQEKKIKLEQIRKFIRGDFLDELYFAEHIQSSVGEWYEKVEEYLSYFKTKIPKEFNFDNLFENKLKLYREIEIYIEYYKEINKNSTYKEGILDYIIEIYIPVYRYVFTTYSREILSKQFTTQNMDTLQLDTFFKFSHRKIKFIKNGRNMTFEELENLYEDLGETTVTLNSILDKRLNKEKTFKGDILKSIRELLLIKGQDVEGFNDLMELYQGTTSYETVLHLKEEIWKFVEKTPTENWVHNKLEIDLEALMKNQEGLKFFKTERFMHYIKEKSDAYTLVDFYMDIVSSDKSGKEKTIETLLIEYIKKNK